MLLTGHAHVASFHTSTNFTEINGGTVGGGAAGNFEKNQPFGLALLSYTRDPASTRPRRTSWRSTLTVALPRPSASGLAPDSYTELTLL